MSQPYYSNPIPPQQPPPPKRKRPVWLYLLGLLALGFILLVVSCAVSFARFAEQAETPPPSIPVTSPRASKAPTSSAPTSSEPGGAQDETAEPVESGPHGDGQYLVGSEIKTGTWKTSGIDEGFGCYAETQNEAGETNDNLFVDKGKSAIIIIKKKDYIFTSQDCGIWKLVKD